MDAALAAGVLLVLVVVLARELVAPAAAMVAALVACVVLGLLPAEEAFTGLSNPATISIAGLFVVARAIRDHAGIDQAIGRFLGDGTGGPRGALLRFVPPVVLLSGLMNNTPLVAAGAPVIRGWGERHGVAATKLLMPLSFAAILGGTLTLVGTAPNLVISGMLVAAGEPALGFFELTPAGLPLAVVGGAALVLLGPRLLPDGRMPHEPLATDRRDDTSRLQASHRGNGSRAYGRLTLATFAAMVVVAATGLVSVLTAILLACAVLVATRAIRFSRAIDALDVDVLLIVAAAIGLGNAIAASGLAEALAGGIHQLGSGGNAVTGLLLVVLGTLVLTELITNVAAAALMLPIAMDVAQRAGADPTGFAVAVAIGASASFLTPVGYQTNTIVYGLGGYRFGDFWRLGLPMAAISLTSIMVVVPWYWG